MENIQKVVPSMGALAPAPDFLKEAGIQGTEILKNYVVPPRLKVVQKSAGAEILKQYGVGDLIATPSLSLVREMGRDSRGNPTGTMAPVKFVPLFFFPEWAQWTDFSKRPQGMSSILRRTTDPNDPLRAKCNNPKLRTESHPDHPEVPVNNVEHLNFIVTLLDHPLSGEAMLISFSRGEHQAGSKFAGLIKMRKAPLFGCVFEMAVSHRPGTGKGDWWGVDVSNPADGKGWVENTEIFQNYKAMFEEFVDVHRQGLIQASYDDDAPVSDVDPAAVKAVSEF